MTTRLQELAQQAWIETAVYSDMGYPISFTERLAELITAECLSRIEDLRGYSGYTDDEIVSTPSWNAALQAAKNQIADLTKPTRQQTSTLIYCLYGI
jgi:hypothetical protein